MLSRLQLACRLHSLTQIRTLATAAFKTNIEAASSLVKQIKQQDKDGMLCVHWRDNKVNRFPYIYLRDNCQCPACYNSKALQRNLDTLKEIELGIQPQNVEVSNDGGKISILWPDKHLSGFDSSWLHRKQLPEKEGMHGKMKLNGKGVEFWDRTSMQGSIPRFEFEKIMSEDAVLYDWLHSLHCVGLALLHGVPKHKDPISVHRLAMRVGYVKSTHYGHTFDVHSKFDANNLAYTTEALPLHCDIPQSEYYPGVQCLHCIQQAPTEGGGNIFVDGFHIAQQLKEQHPKLFDLLSTTHIPYVDIGKDVFGDFHLELSRPVIELNDLGQITRFTYNNHVRDYHMNTPPEETRKVYQGYLLLGQMMRDSENMLQNKLSPGEMVTFNNSRVLHGRQAFKITAAGNRHLEGCYMDWDMIYARLRSLGRRLGTSFYK